MNRSRFVATLVGTLCATAALHGAAAQDASCQLKYPIVMSHHWSMTKLCPDNAPATGPASCMQTLNYEKYCVDKGQDAHGRPTCGEWRVTPEEAELPPRDVNVVEPSLVRDVRGYHRYFSLDIVKRLRDTCGNKVYLSDKPAFASYEVRARSLRNTVRQALAAENADKVIVIGMSQGVQEARYMTALLPMDDADPSQGMMKDRVAALVSLAGEDGGAESAAIGLELLYLLHGGDWPRSPQLMGWKDEDVVGTVWRRAGAPGPVYVLSEQCRGAECNLSAEDRFRWSLRSVYDLAPRYMRPPALQIGLNAPANWNKLRDFVGAQESSWQDIIPPSLEADNGVRYLSYAGRIQNWNLAWGDVLSRDFLLFSSISASEGPNDVHVSVKRQRFANPASNFEHVKTLEGSAWSRGYHHMFYSGRNDFLYVPGPGYRQAAPYNGDSADFYQQVARDLKARGF